MPRYRGGHLLPQCSGHLYKSVYPFRCPVERERDNFETGNGFPRREATVLTVEADRPVRTTVYLRYPSWSEKVTVRVNGKKVQVKQKPGSYIALNRLWRNGDRIEAAYPMRVHLETTPDNPQKGALLYGRWYWQENAVRKECRLRRLSPIRRFIMIIILMITIFRQV